jgi:hypothetical protein
MFYKVIIIYILLIFLLLYLINVFFKFCKFFLLKINSINILVDLLKNILLELELI